MANNFKGIYLTTSANLPNSVLQDNSLTILTDTGEVYFGSLKLQGTKSYVINGSVAGDGTITFSGLVVADLISAVTANTIIIFKPTATYKPILLAGTINGSTYTLNGSLTTNDVSNITNYECIISVISGVASGTYTAKQPGTSEPLTYDLLNDYGCFLSYNSGIVVNIPAMKNLTDLLDSLATLDYKRLSINIKGTSNTGIFYLNSDILDIRKTLTGSTYYLYFSAKTSTNSDALSLVNLTLNPTLYTWATPVQVSSKAWFAVTYADGKFVAVGASGYTTTSTDGITWTTPTAVGGNDWRSITYGAGKFVAISYNGYTTTSTDGITWSSSVQVGGSAWLAITYANNKFVAVGEAGHTMTSVDGITWTTPTAHGSNYWLAITYANNKFVAVGEAGHTMTSVDGITWTTPTTVGGNVWRAVAYADNKFVAVGDTGYITTSTDGISWTTPTTVGSNAWYAIAYNGTKFVAVSDSGYTMTSVDGITWSTPVAVGTQSWRGITYGADKFVAVGASGYTASCNNSTLFNTYYVLSGTLATTEYIRLKIE